MKKYWLIGLGLWLLFMWQLFSAEFRPVYLAPGQVTGNVTLPSPNYIRLTIDSTATTGAASNGTIESERFNTVDAKALYGYFHLYRFRGGANTADTATRGADTVRVVLKTTMKYGSALMTKTLDSTALLDTGRIIYKLVSPSDTNFYKECYFWIRLADSGNSAVEARRTAPYLHYWFDIALGKR